MNDPVFPGNLIFLLELFVNRNVKHFCFSYKDCVGTPLGNCNLFLNKGRQNT